MTEEEQKPIEKKPNQITYLAETNFRHQDVRFGIKRDDRRRHTYVIGKTGMGKSTLMENMIIQDIRNGEGVALVDPHGDFAEKILDFIPSERINDIVYFNPSDTAYPIAFNVMEAVSEEHKHLVASGLIGVFKKLWADSWGPRLEYILRNTILALLDYPGSTLLGVNRMFVDKIYRNKVISKIKDPVVKAFWIDEYSKYSAQFATEAVASIQNKIGQFLSTALIRNVVGQVKSTIDIREIMDKQKILIMNLSKGRIGEDASSLLGAMMITKIQLAAMSRIDIPEKDRKDLYLYVDEFQNFATESFAAILSEARKYRLNLIIGHQYIEQLSEEVAAAVFGNVGTIICFRVGSADAEAMAVEFAPYFEEEDLVNLAKYDVYMKLMIDGVASNPFSATTLPPLAEQITPTGSVEKIIRVSRERYTKQREIVEEKISRWSGMNDDEDDIDTTSGNQNQKNNQGQSSNRSNISNGGDDKKKKKKAKNTYKANCYECGQETEITFKPDGVRPIYCQTCFQKIKEGAVKNQVPSNKIEEVKPEEPQEEISLEQVLAVKPVEFEKKNNPPENNKVKEKKVDEKLKELVDDNPKEVLDKKTNGNESNSIDNNQIQPGQVVKF
ncbi:MAG: type IV secretion system DNA-binding domain-containing protein [Candidatus Buchananbacteria bacterium]|nr:type IV secretion system DNA-binding domain-containing protein [Candidatus Buchananbacteria bacterium]